MCRIVVVVIEAGDVATAVPCAACVDIGDEADAADKDALLGEDEDDTVLADSVPLPPLTGLVVRLFIIVLGRITSCTTSNRASL